MSKEQEKVTDFKSAFENLKGSLNRTSFTRKQRRNIQKRFGIPKYSDKVYKYAEGRVEL